MTAIHHRAGMASVVHQLSNGLQHRAPGTAGTGQWAVHGGCRGVRGCSSRGEEVLSVCRMGFSESPGLHCHPMVGSKVSDSRREHGGHRGREAGAGGSGASQSPSLLGNELKLQGWTGSGDSIPLLTAPGGQFMLQLGSAPGWRPLMQPQSMPRRCNLAAKCGAVWRSPEDIPEQTRRAVLVAAHSCPEHPQKMLGLPGLSWSPDARARSFAWCQGLCAGRARRRRRMRMPRELAAG